MTSAGPPCRAASNNAFFAFFEIRGQWSKQCRSGMRNRAAVMRLSRRIVRRSHTGQARLGGVPPIPCLLLFCVLCSMCPHPDMLGNVRIFLTKLEHSTSCGCTLPHNESVSECKWQQKCHHSTDFIPLALPNQGTDRWTQRMPAKAKAARTTAAYCSYKWHFVRQLQMAPARHTQSGYINAGECVGLHHCSCPEKPCSQCMSSNLGLSSSSSSNGSNSTKNGA